MLIDEFKKAKMYALKEKNEDAKAIYSVLINKCMLALIDKREKGVEITDADYVQIVNKTLKELSDEKEAYAKAGNEAKVASISAQEEICKKYLPTIACELDNPKVEILVQDAIEYIKDKKDEFDIILIDSTDPMGPGEGLFTEEFYTNVKNALKKGGIMVAQSESPFTNKEEIKKMYDLLKKVFPTVSTYTSNIPTYPGGYWAWAFCSVDVKPLEYYNDERANEIIPTCKIYNKEYHNARFALPNYLKELL